MAKDEYLLKKNSTFVSDESGFDNKIKTYQEFNTLYKQKPNRKFFLVIKREGIFFWLQRQKNKNSWLYKTLVKQSEKPAILDTALCRSTMNNMYNFLFNKGYFQVKVDYSIEKKGKKANVNYLVTKGPRTFIDEIRFKAYDPVVQYLLDSTAKESFLTKGKPLDNSLYQSEKVRISQLLYDNGFAEFNPIYIQSLEVDSSQNDANLALIVSNPEGRAKHTQYTVNSVQILPEFNATENDTDLITSKVNDITFIQKKNSKINKNVLLRRIYIDPGELYNRSLMDKTHLQLSKLGLYRFISIETQVDSNSTTQLNYNIRLTPNKRWVFDYGTDFNYTTIRLSSKSLFGISGFVNLKNRNTFHGAEVFNTKLEAGTELNILNLSQSNSINIRYANELSLPDFYDITGTVGIGKFLRKPFKKPIGIPESRTIFKLGVDYENLSKQYWYTSFNTEIGYDFQISRRERILLSTLSFNLYIPDPTPSADFAKILEENIFLAKSFTGRRLLTSFFIGKLNYIHQRKARGNFSSTSISNFELSGLEIYLGNQLYNLISGKSEIFSANNLEFSKFVKLETDQRLYYNFPGNTSLNGRMGIGLAQPYGKNSFVPYVKQFYVGGPQSLRAWNIREVGPGADTISRNKNATFFSAGDIKFEASLEYRFDIIWRFKGAFFLDAGNVWLIPTKENTKGEFTSEFYKQIAFGTGMGLRLDLSYFVFRIDWGFKLRNPYEINNNYWLYSNNDPVSFKKLIKNSNLHLALNYPF